MGDALKSGVLQAAELAKLDLSSNEADELIGQVERIIGYVDKLKELELDGLEATSHVRFLAQPLRDDVVEERISKEMAMKNSPAGDEDFFIVPGVLKGE
jgi:aspartyl-tRNA(Asn)/glutamyl-tRNA(Gln) amidotransferase subunit C